MTPNPRLERTAEKRRFWVPRRLCRRAASQASLQGLPRLSSETEFLNRAGDSTVVMRVE